MSTQKSIEEHLPLPLNHYGLKYHFHLLSVFIVTGIYASFGDHFVEELPRVFENT